MGYRTADNELDDLFRFTENELTRVKPNFANALGLCVQIKSLAAASGLSLDVRYLTFARKVLDGYFDKAEQSFGSISLDPLAEIQKSVQAVKSLEIELNENQKTRLNNIKRQFIRGYTEKAEISLQSEQSKLALTALNKAIGYTEKLDVSLTIGEQRRISTLTENILCLSFEQEAKAGQDGIHALLKRGEHLKPNIGFFHSNDLMNVTDIMRVIYDKKSKITSEVVENWAQTICDALIQNPTKATVWIASHILTKLCKSEIIRKPNISLKRPDFQNRISRRKAMAQANGLLQAAVMQPDPEIYTDFIKDAVSHLETFFSPHQTG